MKRRSFLALGGASILAFGATGVRAQTAPTHARASSPGGVLTVEAFTDNDGRPMYAVLRQGRMVVAPSKLGFLLTDAPALERGLAITAGQPVTFDETCVKAVRNAAEKLGYSHMDIISGAGHDACWVNKVAPTAMIMCPCVDGLSHNEAEEITREWAQAGADVLLHAVLEAAEIVE